jgi:hypothetical protein
MECSSEFPPRPFRFSPDCSSGRKEALISSGLSQPNNGVSLRPLLQYVMWGGFHFSARSYSESR